jgi:hypothetical protein
MKRTPYDTSRQQSQTSIDHLLFDPVHAAQLVKMPYRVSRPLWSPHHLIAMCEPVCSWNVIYVGAI